MTRLSYIVRGINGRPFHTVSYAEATKPGCRIVRTIFTKVVEPEDEKAVDYLVSFWRKHR